MILLKEISVYDIDEKKCYLFKFYNEKVYCKVIYSIAKNPLDKTHNYLINIYSYIRNRKQIDTDIGGFIYIYKNWIDLYINHMYMSSHKVDSTHVYELNKEEIMLELI